MAEVPIEAPLILSRADYDRTRRAMYRLFRFARDDARWPKLAPPGSIRLVAADPSDDTATTPDAWTPAWADQYDVVVLLYPARGGAPVPGSSDGSSSKTAWLGFGPWGTSYPSPPFDPTNPPAWAIGPVVTGLGREEALAAGYGVRRRTGDWDWAGWDRSVMVESDDAVRLVGGVAAWVEEAYQAGLVTQAALVRPADTSRPVTASDAWWYDTDWGRQPVQFTPPDLARDVTGGWSPAERVPLVPGQRALVQNGHPYLRGQPLNATAKTRGAWAVEAAYALVAHGFGRSRYRLQDVGGGLMVGAYAQSDASGWGGIVHVIEDAFRDVRDEVERIDDNVEKVDEAIDRLDEGIESAARAVRDEVERVDDNALRVGLVIEEAARDVRDEAERVDENLQRLYDVIRDPKDLIVSVARTLSGGAMVMLIFAPVLLPLMGPAGLLLGSAAASAVPEDIREELARAAVYVEGFIPLAPQAIEELAVQALNSRRERDGLRVELMQLRTKVASGGGAWLAVAKKVVGAATSIVIAIGTGGASFGFDGAMFTALKALGSLAISAAEAGLQITNLQGLAKAAKSAARERNQARAEAAAARSARARQEADRIRAELAALEAELARLQGAQVNSAGGSAEWEVGAEPRSGSGALLAVGAAVALGVVVLKRRKAS